MKGLKTWGWILFATSFVIFWSCALFVPMNMNRLNGGQALLLMISFVCFILSITVWTIVRAINESRMSKLTKEVIHMKEVIISADGDSKVFLVPDVVADNLREYCIEFSHKWMMTSPHAEKYRLNEGWCFNEEDFIEYLNEYIFPEQKSVLVKNLGWTDLGENLPAEYQDHPYFNF